MAKKKITLKEVYDMVLDALARHEIYFVELRVEAIYKYEENREFYYYVRVKQTPNEEYFNKYEIYARSFTSELLLSKLENRILEVKTLLLEERTKSEQELLLIEE